MTIYAAKFNQEHLPEKVLGADLFKKFSDAVAFDATKVNVIVGPNGSGKTFLLTQLAKLLCCYEIGHTSFSRNLFDREHYREVEGQRWSDDRYEYVPGVDIMSDGSVGYYYCPGMFPGHRDGFSDALCSGYNIEELVKEIADQGYNERTISTGQFNKTVLYMRLNNLFKKDQPKRSGRNYAEELEKDVKCFASYQLPAFFKKVPRGFTNEHPVYILDEPESGLDSKAVKDLWKFIMGVDPRKAQFIIATHNTAYEKPEYADRIHVIDLNE